MTRFEIDTSYDNGSIVVAARNGSRVSFYVDDAYFCLTDVIEEDGFEYAAIEGKEDLIKADDNAPYSSFDVDYWLKFALALEYTDSEDKLKLEELIEMLKQRKEKKS